MLASIFYYAAAKAYIRAIDNNGLTWRHCTLGLIKSDEVT
jgi:hypothetical protein